MTELNASIRNITMPARMARRPISNRGFPVPYFVTHRDADGNWDFRAIEFATVVNCVRKRLCWLCGEPLGKYLAFVIGPMCAINRISSEPPSHRDCAEYAMKACPFLTRPAMRRNEVDLPAGAKDSYIGGIGVTHNPGVMLLWITKSYRVVGDGAGGMLIKVGDPVELHYHREGRTATRPEIDAAIEKGLPYLRALAKQEGNVAERELEAMVKRAQQLLPAE